MRLEGATIALLVDYQFEDLELMYPKLRLEEEGAKTLLVGAHDAGTLYKGKHGYPVASTYNIDALGGAEAIDALVIPGGFAPDYMRRNCAMLQLVADCIAADKPVAAICHGPWMLCSARDDKLRPVVEGRKATAFIAIKDDVVNAGAQWVDAPVVVDGPLITSRTPADLTPFCGAIIDEVARRRAA